jgi:hypothetical protein
MRVKWDGRVGWEAVNQETICVNLILITYIYNYVVSMISSHMNKRVSLGG